MVLNSIAFADETKAAPETCKSKLTKIVESRQDKAGSAFGIFLASSLFMAPTGGLSMPITGAAATPFIISLKTAQHSLKILTEAEIGQGKNLNQLWKKFNNKYPQQAKQTTFDKFVNAIHEADVDGSACKDKKVPKNKDYYEINLDDQEKESKLGETELNDMMSIKNNLEHRSNDSQVKKIKIEDLAEEDKAALDQNKNHKNTENKPKNKAVK